ncbi:hypothetical protein ANOM_010400, partial [Aspergillus nomiae NRRL 13137]
MGRWRFNQRDASVAAAINTLFTPIKYDPSTSLSQLLSQVSSKSSAYENDHFRSFFKEIKHRPSIHHGLVVPITVAAVAPPASAPPASASA